MQMLNDLEVATPPIEGQIPGAHENMAVILRGKGRNLWVKHPTHCGDGLNLVVLSSSLRPLLTQSRADAHNVR